MFKKGTEKKKKMPKNVDSSKYYRLFADFEYLKRKNYKIVKEIGRGGYGVVYKVIMLRLTASFWLMIINHTQ